MMVERGLVQQFHLTVEAVNGKLVKEFETGSEPASVARRVGDILVPAIHILQARTNNNPSGKDSTILEEVSFTNTSNQQCNNDLLSFVRSEVGGWP